MKVRSVAPLSLIALLGATLLPLQSFGELSHRDLRGIEAWVDHPGASPLDGYTLLKTSLQNRRFFGNYGPPRPGLGCLEFASRTREQLVANADCPHDKTSEWIQRLFPSPDRAHLLVNQIPSDVVSHLTPFAIGRVLEAIAQIPDSEWTTIQAQPELRETYTTQLSDVLFEAMNPEKFSEWKEKQHKSLEKLLRVRSWRTAPSDDDRRLREEWDQVTSTLSRLSTSAEAGRSRFGSLFDASLFDGWDSSSSLANSPERGSPASPTTSAAASDRSSQDRVSSQGSPSSTRSIGKRKDYLSLAELFVAALLESRVLDARDHTTSYPKYFPEQTLLAFFLQKADTKADLVSLFRGMSTLLKDPTALLDPGKISAFVSHQWTDADYDRDLIKARVRIKLDRFLEDREFMMYFFMEDKIRTQLIPPSIYYGQAGHESMGTATYPDCGETSLRNFFNIILYRPEDGIFDARRLEDLEKTHPEMSISPALKEFYQKHSLASEASLQSVRDEWSETVTSRHPGVHYVNPKEGTPQCEIAGGFDNLMTVFDRLLSLSDPPESPPRSRSEKLDTLCRLFSSESQVLTWEVEDAIDPAQSRSQLEEATAGVKIVFSLGGSPAFSWQFTPRHFVVSNLRPESSVWKQFAGIELLKPLPASPSPKELNPVIQLLPWFPGHVVSRKLDNTAWSNPTFMQVMTYALPLQRTSDKIEALKAILSSPRTPLDLVLAMKSLAERLKTDVLRSRDARDIKPVLGALSDADFPYGDPPHLLGDPLFRYERMTEEQIYFALGSGTQARKASHKMASTLGSSWRRADQDPETNTWTPVSLIWSGPVPGEDGRPAQMNWTQAMNYCLQLNPASTRAAIRAKLDRKKRPYRGCFLPRKVDYQRLAEDMSYFDGQGEFLPQISYLSGHTFWTASSTSGAQGTASAWSSHDALEYVFATETEFEVRCVCVPHSWDS